MFFRPFLLSFGFCTSVLLTLPSSGLSDSADLFPEISLIEKSTTALETQPHTSSSNSSNHVFGASADSSHTGRQERSFASPSGCCSFPLESSLLRTWDEILSKAEKTEKQIIVLAADSLLMPVHAVVGKNVKFHPDAIVLFLLSRDFTALFSLPVARDENSISLICMRLPKKDEQATGFLTLRQTFVREGALRKLVSIQGSLFEAINVLLRVRE